MKGKNGVGVTAGFTLIELLVVASISLSLFAVIVVSYRNYSVSQSIQAAAEEIRTKIELARLKAIAGEKPSSGCDALSGYRFSVTTATKTLTWQAVCSGSPAGTIYSHVLEKVSLTANGFPISFSSLTGIANQNASVQVSYPGLSATPKTVYVYASGATEVR